MVDGANEGRVGPVVETITPAVHPLASQVADALRGAVFPLSRRQVLEVARENESARTLLSLLSALPNRSFRSEDDVAATLDEDIAPAG